MSGHRLRPFAPEKPANAQRFALSQLWTLGICLAPLVALPAPALAHASDRGHVLLLPTGHYVIGGALAVAASFLTLAFVPPPVNAGRRWRLRLGSVNDRWRLLASLASFAILSALVLAGFTGSRDPLSNPLPLVIWTLLWVGLTLVQGVLGNLWAWINPWYGPWRIARTLLGESSDDTPPVVLPSWVAQRPAVFLLVAFVWFELIYPAPDDPERLAVVVGVYWLLTFVAMLIFGHEEWSKRGEFLSVFFRMLAGFGTLESRRDGDGNLAINLCLPGAKLDAVGPLPLSGTLFLLVALASVSFDGLSKTFLWLGINGINPLEYPGRTALMGINTAGLAGSIVLLSGLCLLSVALGERLAGNGKGLVTASGLLVWSIVPIALAYHFAHYLTALVVNGQYALVALSDPFSLGWNLFGTAYMQVEAGIAMGSAAAWVVWNLQALAIVGGHVLAVLATHRLAFRLHDSPRVAFRSQLPLAALMIGYTMFGLWLLSTPTGA